MKKIGLVFCLVLFFSISFEVYSQISPQIQLYRDDAKGDINNRKENILDSNKVRTLFCNNGEVGHWPLAPSGEWPIGTGQSYIDGVSLLIASEITAPDNGQIVHPLITSYREWMDSDPNTGLKWGLEPIAGYSNSQSQIFALSSDQNTWPEIWPASLNLSSEWNGHWYGYFGRDVFNANQETFFVMDDSKDKEWARPPFGYYPISSDSDRAGLGLRLEVRGFQWDSNLIEDIIFWHYDIINISDFSYPKTYFGFYTDAGVGGTNDNEDDRASFDTNLDLVYCYDYDGIGSPSNWITGYYGYAYLESPGNAVNFIDDDDDGMVDESRDDGIDNDGDWLAYADLNGNGIWDPQSNEPLNNDLGADGVGPDDSTYTGPDNGEGDGFPTDGEPNFDKTDKDESDQIGLVAVSVYRLGQGGTGGGYMKDDESIWLKMSTQVFDTSMQNANISVVFSSGPFPFVQGSRERFSVSLLFGENLTDLLYNKQIAQLFYNENYRFPDSITSINREEESFRADNYRLSQNYPNPFNPSTKISWQSPVGSWQTLKVYDILGNEVATLVNEYRDAGSYEVDFQSTVNSHQLANGVYFYQLRVGDYVETKKMILLK